MKVLTSPNLKSLVAELLGPYLLCAYIKFKFSVVKLVK